MTATTEAPAGSKTLRPHQWLSDPLPPLEQPPRKFAHLQGEALRLALINDDETWTVERLALEAGRKKRSVDRWVGNYVRHASGKRPMCRNTTPRPTYIGAVPTWRAGDLRAWMMRTEKMNEDGTYIPYRPGGRPRGITEAAARAGRDAASEMEKQAPEVLKAYEELTAESNPDRKTPKEARAILAERYACSVRGVIRRCQRGRDLRAGRRSGH